MQRIFIRIAFNIIAVIMQIFNKLQGNLFLLAFNDTVVITQSFKKMQRIFIRMAFNSNAVIMQIFNKLQGNLFQTEKAAAQLCSSPVTIFLLIKGKQPSSLWH